MAKVSAYLNFPGNTEEAFNFNRKVFGKGIYATAGNVLVIITGMC